MNDQEGNEFGQRVVRVLDDSLQSLDAATLSRLNRSRQAALATRRRHRSWVWGGGLAVAGASGLALMLAIGLHGGADPLRGEVDATARMTDEALLGGDDLDMYRELEFYAWLGDKAELDHGSGGSGEHL